MTINSVQRPTLPRPHDARHLGLDQPTLQLQLTKPRRQHVIIALSDPIDEPQRHLRMEPNM
jgi:hypothetical protein